MREKRNTERWRKHWCIGHCLWTRECWVQINICEVLIIYRKFQQAGPSKAEAIVRFVFSELDCDPSSSCWRWRGYCLKHVERPPHHSKGFQNEGVSDCVLVCLSGTPRSQHHEVLLIAALQVFQWNYHELTGDFNPIVHFDEMEHPQSHSVGQKVACSSSPTNAAQPFSKATISSHAKFLEIGEMSNFYPFICRGSPWPAAACTFPWCLCLACSGEANPRALTSHNSWLEPQTAT